MLKPASFKESSENPAWQMQTKDESRDISDISNKCSQRGMSGLVQIFDGKASLLQSVRTLQRKASLLQGFHRESSLANTIGRQTGNTKMKQDEVQDEVQDETHCSPTCQAWWSCSMVKPVSFKASTGCTVKSASVRILKADGRTGGEWKERGRGGTARWKP